MRIPNNRHMIRCTTLYGTVAAKMYAFLQLLLSDRGAEFIYILLRSIIMCILENGGNDNKFIINKCSFTPPNLSTYSIFLIRSNNNKFMNKNTGNIEHKKTSDLK